MKVEHYQVTKFKSIEDSGKIELGDITCLVGKNESGKTALLHALARINPAGPIEPNFKLEDYPRKDLTTYRRQHEKNPENVVEVTFELSDSETENINDKFGNGVVRKKCSLMTIARNYKNTSIYTNFYDVFDQAAHVSFRIESAGITGEAAKTLKKAKDLSELKKLAETIEDPTESIKQLAASLSKADEKTFFNTIIDELELPEFFYFDEYATLPGEVRLQELTSRIKAHESNSVNEFQSSDYTASALLKLANVEIKDFLDQGNYESLKASLEAASNHISDQIFKYWSQNRDLAVEFDLHPEHNGSTLIDTILKIRIKNNRHRVTVPFDERSRGFVWFFSFLVAFADHAERKENIVLLLDEPGLALHARAQADLLRYIEQELAPKHQILYTSHSPFMIDPHHLERVRTVEDIDYQGTKVFDSPLRSDPDTIFPLQTALGYDLAQTLFLGPKCLLVEGPSDFVYLTIASDMLIEAGQAGLPEDLVIIPVGGADKICTFVSLLGANQLSVAVLMDLSSRDQQRIEDLIANKHLHKNRLFTYAGFIDKKEADIEDLFGESDYIEIIQACYSEQLGDKSLDLTAIKHPRIIERVKSAFKSLGLNHSGFSHYRPARELMKNTKLQRKVYRKDILDRFEAIFTAIAESMKQ